MTSESGQGSVQESSGSDRRTPAVFGSRAPPVLVQEPTPGTVLKDFRIVEQLGRGGMSSVYLAEHVARGSKVAIKVLHPDLADDPRIAIRLITEAKALKLVRHPNVVELFELGSANGLRYLVLEYLQGAPLVQVPPGALGLVELIHLLEQICDALAAIHARGVIHRDLTIANVFLTRRLDAPRFAKLIDFGLAKIASDRTSSLSTQHGTVLGTPAYSAPEQVIGQATDGRADLYSLGVIAYVLVTGRIPFASLAAKMANRPPPPHAVDAGVPEALSRAILKALMPEPADRFQTAQELRSALTAVLGRRPPVASAPLVSQAPRVPAGPAITVVREDGRVVCEGAHVEWAPGGALIAWAGALPAIGSKVVLALEAPRAFIPATVVRHLGTLEAPAWQRFPGFAVQTANLDPALGRAIARAWPGGAR